MLNMGHWFSGRLDPLGRMQMSYFETLQGVEQAFTASLAVQQTPLASVLLGFSKLTTFRSTIK